MILRPTCAYLSEELEAAGEHGVDTADAREIERGGQLGLAHAKPQQVPRRHIALQNLLKQIVQRLREWGNQSMSVSLDSCGAILNH